MSVHTYTREAGHGGKALSKAIEAAFRVDQTFRIACAVDCVITFDDDLSAGEIESLDGIVIGFSDLSDQKVLRTSEIDARTRELIDVAHTTGVGVVATITSDAVTLRASIESSKGQTELDAVTDTRD